MSSLDAISWIICILHQKRYASIFIWSNSKQKQINSMLKHKRQGIDRHASENQRISKRRGERRASNNNNNNIDDSIIFILAVCLFK